MKKIYLMTIVSILAIVGFYACNKVSNETTEFTPLEDAQFITTSTGQIVRFSEDEDFSFSNKLANKLGFQEITIERGIYDINYNKSDFGTVILKVKHFELSNKGSLNKSMENTVFFEEGSDDGIGGIRIAKRKKKTCGGEPVTCSCCCGIGFRCGTTGFGDEDGDEEEELQEIESQSVNVLSSSTLKSTNPRRKKAKFYFNESNRTLTIRFTEFVDWKALN